MITVSVLIILSNWYLSKFYDKIEEAIPPKAKQENKFKNIRPLLGLAVVAFIIMFKEGAVEHWSNLFLFDVIQVQENQAEFGFIAFSFCVALRRFLGDGISKKFGAINIIIGGSVIAFAGYLLICFRIWYFRMRAFWVIPEIFRLAGQTKNVQASVGISLVSGIGFAGFLLGPVLLGFISNWADLTWSFIFLSFSILLVLCLTFLGLRKNYKSP